MLIAVPAHCLQRASVLILLRVRAMLIEVPAHCSQLVSVSISLRAQSMLIEAISNCSDTCYVLAYLYWAVAQAEPDQSQVVIDGFGPACSSPKLEPSEARPRPRLSGQGGPEHHYLCCGKLVSETHPPAI
jgi:hypothetical protein